MVLQYIEVYLIEMKAYLKFKLGQGEMLTMVEISFTNLSEILKWHYAQGLVRYVDFENDNMVIYTISSIIDEEIDKRVN